MRLRRPVLQRQRSQFGVACGDCILTEYAIDSTSGMISNPRRRAGVIMKHFGEPVEIGELAELCGLMRFKPLLERSINSRLPAVARRFKALDHLR